MPEIPTEEFDTNWVNYWDANPEDHGGRFVRWDADSECWEIVEVTAPGDLPSEFAGESEYLVEQYWVYPDNVWVDGEPENGFTDDMESILESLDATNHFEAPGGEPFIDRIEYYVADFVHYLHDDRHKIVDVEDYDNYDDMIAAFGVEDYE